LPETDVLFLLAELGVALAGFTAIIGVLGSRPGVSDVRVDVLRLQVMLETSLFVAAASIVPALLEHFGVEPRNLWRIASAIFLLVQVPLELVALRRTRNMPDMTYAKVNVNTINWCLSIGADLFALGVLLDVVGTFASAFYLLTIFSLLTMSGLLFIQFAASTFYPPNE
jgi:hypothetical protein